MEMPRTTDAHRKLELLTGNWIGEETMYPSPWAPQGGKAMGRCLCRLALNGFAAIVDYQQEKDGVVTFSGHGVFTYDANHGCYVQHWFDCMGSPPEIFRGNFEGDVLTMISQNPRCRMRSTADYSTPGRLVSRMETSQDGESWTVLFEGTYTRR